LFLEQPPGATEAGLCATESSGKSKEGEKKEENNEDDVSPLFFMPL
jgi:hypothetical protein